MTMNYQKEDDIQLNLRVELDKHGHDLALIAEEIGWADNPTPPIEVSMERCTPGFRDLVCRVANAAVEDHLAGIPSRIPVYFRPPPQPMSLEALIRRRLMDGSGSEEALRKQGINVKLGMQRKYYGVGCGDEGGAGEPEDDDPPPPASQTNGCPMPAGGGGEPAAAVNGDDGLIELSDSDGEEEANKQGNNNSSPTLLMKEANYHQHSVAASSSPSTLSTYDSATSSPWADSFSKRTSLAAALNVPANAADAGSSRHKVRDHFSEWTSPPRKRPAVAAIQRAKSKALPTCDDNAAPSSTHTAPMISSGIENIEKEDSPIPADPTPTPSPTSTTTSVLHPAIETHSTTMESFVSPPPPSLTRSNSCTAAVISSSSTHSAAVLGSEQLEMLHEMLVRTALHAATRIAGLSYYKQQPLPLSVKTTAATTIRGLKRPPPVNGYGPGECGEVNGGGVGGGEVGGHGPMVNGGGTHMELLEEGRVAENHFSTTYSLQQLLSAAPVSAYGEKEMGKKKQVQEEKVGGPRKVANRSVRL